MFPYHYAEFIFNIFVVITKKEGDTLTVEAVSVQSKNTHQQLKLKSDACPLCATGLDVKHTVSSGVIYALIYIKFTLNLLNLKLVSLFFSGCSYFESVCTIRRLYVATKNNRFMQYTTEKNWHYGGHGSESRFVNIYKHL